MQGGTTGAIVSGWIVDLRHAVQRLARTPGFAIAAIAMLALGIGFSVAMYSVLNGVLLRSLPFPASERIVVVRAENPAQHVRNAQFTSVEAETLAAGTPGFAALGYYWWSGVTLFDGERAREITSHMVGPGYFGVLGVEPVLGRLLSDDDIRGDRPFALLSFAEWQRGFGGDPGVLGRRLELVDEDPLEVIGVLPPQLDLIADDTGVWRPLPARFLSGDGMRDHRRNLLMLGRLADGSSGAQADAGLSAVLAGIGDSRGAEQAGWSAATKPLLDALIGDTRAALWGAFALAVLVLVIAAANVAILLDGRQVARRREQAVMQALGASRARLRRMLLLELGVLAAAAVGLGLAVALAAMRGLRELARDSIARIDEVGIDWQVYAFAVLLGLAAPVAAALAGSLRVRGEAGEAIRAGGRGVVGRAGQRRALPALAMALSTISLIAALVIASGLWRLQRVDPGYLPTHVQAMQFFRGGKDAFVPFTVELLERLAALPGVRDVALTSAAPRSGIGSASVDIRVADRAESEPLQAGLRRVSPGYRDLLGIRLLAGRDFDSNDRRGAPLVAIINATLAKRLFGEADALGRTLNLPLGRGERVDCEIVGVVGDIRNDGLRAPLAPEILVPYAQQPIHAMTFLARSERPLAGIAAQMAAELHALDPRQAITRQYALSEDIEYELRPAQFFARTIGAFAGVALLLAVLGVYAVASLRQRHRVGEHGLRLAIGARPLQLAVSVIGDSLSISALGVLAGTAGVIGIMRVADLRALGIEGGASAAMLAAGVGAMGVAALVAALVPALRAARVAPMEALRNE